MQRAPKDPAFMRGVDLIAVSLNAAPGNAEPAIVEEPVRLQHGLVEVALEIHPRLVAIVDGHPVRGHASRRRNAR